MKDVILSLILGMALGAIITGFYFDGVVAQQYKQRISILASTLTRADSQIKQKDNDIVVLTNYIDQLLTIEEENKKLNSKNRF